MRKIIGVLLVIGLTGCGFVAQEQSRNALMASRDAYKSCLQTNKPALCTNQKLIYEADLKAFDATKLKSHTPSFSSETDGYRMRNTHCTSDFAGGMNCISN